jgi:hypothetical protein
MNQGLLALAGWTSHVAESEKWAESA